MFLLFIAGCGAGMFLAAAVKGNAEYMATGALAILAALAMAL